MSPAQLNEQFHVTGETARDFIRWAAEKGVSDDQIIYLIEKVEQGRKLEAARSLQYYLIEKILSSY